MTTVGSGAVVVVDVAVVLVLDVVVVGVGVVSPEVPQAASARRGTSTKGRTAREGSVPAVLFGITMFATDTAIPVPDLARALEERGFQSLYLPEHTHIPVSRRTPPPTGEAELAEEYSRTVD